MKNNLLFVFMLFHICLRHHFHSTCDSSVTISCCVGLTASHLSCQNYTLSIRRDIRTSERAFCLCRQSTNRLQPLVTVTFTIFYNCTVTLSRIMARSSPLGTVFSAEIVPGFMKLYTKSHQKLTTTLMSKTHHRQLI